MEHRGSLKASTSGRGLEGSVPHVFTPGFCHKRQRRRLREFEHLCRGLAGKGTKSRAIAITWEDLAELEDSSSGDWGDNGTPAQARPDIRPASVLPVSRAKPLKINRDLLLVSTMCSFIPGMCMEHRRSYRFLVHHLTRCCPAVSSQDPQTTSASGSQPPGQVGAPEGG